jgi:hypothetical protein
MLFAAVPDAADASDYFPLKAGCKWHYVEEGAFDNLSYVDVALPPTDVAGVPATPVETRVQSKVIETRYYRVVGDTVILVAYDPKSPLVPPQPIFSYASGKNTWTYSGKVPFLGDNVPIELRGRASGKGTREVLDGKRECIETVIDAKILGGPGMTIEFNQVSLYAKGIGLVEMKQKQKAAGKTSETKIRLIRFEPAT